MRCHRKYFDKDGAGEITMTPEDAEDMWHAYNLIQVGDSLKADTVRKVTQESSTGSTSSQRVRTKLTISVEAVEYDTHAGALHVKGRNVEENPHVKMGAYHTLDLELNRKFTLAKPCWDTIYIERVETACDPTHKADLAAVVMQEGIAHVCLVTDHMTLVRAKIDVSIPRKRKGFSDQHLKGLTKFYDQVMSALLRHVKFDVVKCVMIASPGFVKDQFFEYMMQQAGRLETAEHKLLIENRSKFVLVHSSSGFKHSLNEVLADPTVCAKLANTKASEDIKILDEFYSILQTEPARAYYGLSHVEKANEQQAIDTLLLTDALFRSNDILQRKRYIKLVESVKEQGAPVRLFSSLHTSGERLATLTGVAAILRFPVPEIEEEDEEMMEDGLTTEAACSSTMANGR